MLPYLTTYEMKFFSKLIVHKVKHVLCSYFPESWGWGDGEVILCMSSCDQIRFQYTKCHYQNKETVFFGKERMMEEQMC